MLLLKPEKTSLLAIKDRYVGKYGMIKLQENLYTLIINLKKSNGNSFTSEGTLLCYYYQQMHQFFTFLLSSTAIFFTIKGGNKLQMYAAPLFKKYGVFTF